MRQIAGDLGVSLTPAREALQLANGVLEMEPNRSVRVPLMTRAKVLGLRDIRARGNGDHTTERLKLREFWFLLFAAAICRSS